MDNVWIILVDSHANALMDMRESAVTLRLVHLFTYNITVLGGVSSLDGEYCG